MNCQHVEHLLPLLADGDPTALEQAERDALQQHLASCPKCPEELRLLRETISALAYLPELVPPPALREGVRRRVERRERWRLRRLWTLLAPGPGLRLAAAAASLLIVATSFLVFLSASERTEPWSSPERAAARSSSAPAAGSASADAPHPAAPPPVATRSPATTLAAAGPEAAEEAPADSLHDAAQPRQSAEALPAEALSAAAPPAAPTVPAPAAKSAPRPGAERSEPVASGSAGPDVAGPTRREDPAGVAQSAPGLLRGGAAEKPAAVDAEEAPVPGMAAPQAPVPAEAEQDDRDQAAAAGAEEGPIPGMTAPQASVPAEAERDDRYQGAAALPESKREVQKGASGAGAPGTAAALPEAKARRRDQAPAAARWIAVHVQPEPMAKGRQPRGRSKKDTDSGSPRLELTPGLPAALERDLAAFADGADTQRRLRLDIGLDQGGAPRFLRWPGELSGADARALSALAAHHRLEVLAGEAPDTPPAGEGMPAAASEPAARDEH
jgi:hypothetical protein